MDNPLPKMTYLEQAFQFKVDVIGPLNGQSVVDVMSDLGFQNYKDWMKQQDNGEWLESRTFDWQGEKYILIYNSTKLGLWRSSWKPYLQPGEASYRRPS